MCESPWETTPDLVSMTVNPFVKLNNSQLDSKFTTELFANLR